MFLTTYVDHHPGSAQYNWFIADMTTNLNRAITPWVVVVGALRSERRLFWVCIDGHSTACGTLQLQ